MEEQQKLASAIIMKRIKTEKDASDIFGDIYTLLERPEELQDVREFATIINSCGRTGNHQIALRLLLGDYSAIEKSWTVMEKYRGMIGNGLNWIKNNPKNIIKTENATFILAKKNIHESIIGTVSMILLNSEIIDSSKPIFGMAYSGEDKIKVSARISKTLKPINLKSIISKTAISVGGEGGGHPSAAGAVIPINKEDEFIRIIGGEIIKQKMV